MDDTTSAAQVATSPAGDAAREFRASLEQRRAADDIGAPSLEARQRAATYADDIVRHADALAERIEAEARERAEKIVAEAQTRADRTVADAEAVRVALLSVLERTRAELTAPGTTPAAPAGVDLLFGAVEATRPVAPPSSSATPSSPPRRPAWP